MNENKENEAFNKLFLVASIACAVIIFLATGDLGETFIFTIMFIFALMVVFSH